MTATKTNGPPPGRADEQAPVLVLLHGGGPGVDALGNWATVRPALSASFRCLAPDLLGFGTQVTTGEADGAPRSARGPGRGPGHGRSCRCSTARACGGSTCSATRPPAGPPRWH